MISPHPGTTPACSSRCAPPAPATASTIPCRDAPLRLPHSARIATATSGHRATDSVTGASHFRRLDQCLPFTPLFTFSRFFGSLRALLTREYGVNWYSSYDNIPAPLFSGVSQRCTIWIGDRNKPAQAAWVAPMVRWRSEYRPCLLYNVGYTAWDGFDRASIEVAKLPSNTLREYYSRLLSCDSAEQVRFAPDARNAPCQLYFSQAARNFVSVFLSEPPCFDVKALHEAPQTKIGSVGASSRDVALAGLSVTAAETYLCYWLIRGDGFDVTGWIVADYLVSLNCVSPGHYAVLVELGKLLDERRGEAVVFKKNAGKYVGNYNYWSLAEIARRADLVLLAGLGLERRHADEVREYVQRVLSINEHAGEKGIPAAVRAKVKPRPVDAQAQTSLFARADKLIREHFGYTDRELQAILSYDLRDRSEPEADTGDE